MRKGTRVRVISGDCEGATGVVKEESALLGADSVLFDNSMLVGDKLVFGGYFHDTRLRPLEPEKIHGDVAN